MKIDYILNLINPLNNCESIGIELCKAMRINITRTNLIKEITEHPDYPSLLSISDALTLNGAENVALKTRTESYFYNRCFAN